jgi:hypothetical protein
MKLDRFFQQLTQLVAVIESVEQWSRAPQGSERAEWLLHAVAWDVVAAVTMTWAAHEVEEQENVDALLRSGLAEITAGPGEHVVALAQEWRRALGGGRCRIDAAARDELEWVRERLSLPPPPGAGAAARRALADHAARAGDTRGIVRVDCGGSACLLVGQLAGRLVPIMKT